MGIFFVKEIEYRDNIWFRANYVRLIGIGMVYFVDNQSLVQNGQEDSGAKFSSGYYRCIN